jgi:hypothetical protein
MKKHIRLFLIVFLLLTLSACDIRGLFGQFGDGQSRTFYETLDLDTPKSAVRTFTRAFQREDFMSVYLILATRTQFIIHQQINLMMYDQWFDTAYIEEIFEDVTVFSEGIGKAEHIDSGWYLFDQVMLAAKEHSALLIDLSGEVKIIDSYASEDIGDLEAVDVVATVEGIDGDVVFRMVQAPSGRWRVYQVIVEGGDEEMIPWAVPHEDD